MSSVHSPVSMDVNLLRRRAMLDAPRLGLTVLSALVAAGCTRPVSEEGTSRASYVGDRSSVAFEEIVVTVPVGGTPVGYQNLHVQLGAVVNPRELSFATIGDARGIVYRLEPRMAAAVVAFLCNRDVIAPSTLAALRQQIVTEAENVLRNALASWTHAEEFDIQILVTSLYFTQGAVGRTSRARAWW